MLTLCATHPTPVNEASEDGFTAADLVALGEVHSSALAQCRWGQSQIVSNEFAQYLAVWGPQSSAEEAPTLALARFRRTGSYVLTMGESVLATGERLSDVLPAFVSCLDRSARAP